MKKAMFACLDNLVHKIVQLDYDHRHYYDRKKSLIERINIVKKMIINTFGISALFNMSNSKLKQLDQIEGNDDESDSEED
jgi:hypothetical protein